MKKSQNDKNEKSRRDGNPGAESRRDMPRSAESRRFLTGRRKYSVGLKTACVCLQALCVAAAVLAVMTVSFWTNGTFRLTELGRSFEESSIFLNDAEGIVRSKINCSRNEALFETGGQEDLQKKIDIRQYVSGVFDTANQNENTTYTISDLINFYPSTGDLQAVIDRIEGSGNPADASYDNLSGQTAGLETILPVSGNSLADTARLSGSPYTKLSEYYSDLCQTSADIYQRYQSYSAEQENPGGEASQQAPGNISYFIENTTTKDCYTNLDARSCSEAKSLVASSDDLEFLFEGVRTMNIMVADTEHSLNQAAISKFIDAVFLGANERVLLAFDPSYTAGDTLHEDYLSYQLREPRAIGGLVMGLLSAAALAVLLSMSIGMAGRKDRDTLLAENWFDRIPAEIAAGIILIVTIAWYYTMRLLLDRDVLRAAEHQNFWYAALAVTEYLLFLAAVLSMVRRHRHGTLVTNTVMYTVVRVSRQVLTAKVTYRKMITVYVLFILANFLLLRFAGPTGMIIVLVMDLALLLYLVRDQLGKLSVKQGLSEISKGKLDYKVDTHGLTGDSLEMAEAVNEMGDGLQEAVDSMVKNERLKAELITNVSHDLKTPLTSVINYVDLLRRLDIQDERAREYIEILDHKSQRLKSLITDLIDASKISSGNVELNISPIDFRSMLLMAEGEFEERFEEAGLTASLHLSKKAVMIMADGAQLYRVLDNLFSNIAKYARTGTEVKITMTEEGGKVTASFANISRDLLEKSGDELLERFVRGDKSRSSSEGSGLGLSIAKNLTDLMGGSFRVTAEDYQYTASVTFPVMSGQ